MVFVIGAPGLKPKDSINYSVIKELATFIWSYGLALLI